MPADTICFMCGDILEMRSRGPCPLAYHVGPDADHEGWEVWRCPTCGFVAVRENPTGVPGEDMRMRN